MLRGYFTKPEQCNNPVWQDKNNGDGDYLFIPTEISIRFFYIESFYFNTKNPNIADHRFSSVFTWRSAGELPYFKLTVALHIQ